MIDFARVRGRSRRRSARSSWWTWRTSPGSSRRACIRRRCRTPTSSRPPRTRRCAGRAAGMILCKAEHAKAIDKAVFPGTQGGPLEHVIAAKAVALQGSARIRRSTTYAKQVVAQRARARRRRSSEHGFHIVSGGTDNHLMLVDLRNKGAHRQGRRDGARPRGDHGEQEHGAERDAVAVRDERHPHRHAGRDDARHGRSRDGARSPTLIDRVLDDPENESVLREVRADVRELSSTFPLYPTPATAPH